MKYKIIFLIIGILFVVLSLAFVGYQLYSPQALFKDTIDQSSKLTQLNYKNTQYGFNFSLPLSWQGYNIIKDTWQGLNIGGVSGEQVVESGPKIIIRHPLWSETEVRQDIPIMIFTLTQWQDLQSEKFHIGAAPVGPSELGRNTEYVFALPARYNFAFPKGYEEVELIVQNKPLQTF